MAQLKEKENQSGSEREARTIALIQRVSTFNWYENAGEEKGRPETEEILKVFATENELAIKWITKSTFAASYGEGPISKTGLYDYLEISYQNIVKEAQEKGVEAEVAKAVDAVTDSVFHVAFDKAFEIFSETNEELAKHAVELAVFLSLTAYAQEAAGYNEENRFVQLVEALEQGHLPVDIKEGVLYVL